MQSKAETVEAYLAELPEERRTAISAIRDVIRANLPAGYEEGMQYGHIGYYVPHSRFKAGYHCDPKEPLPFVGLASQKNHMGLYIFCLYCRPQAVETFKVEWLAAGKKLDMGAGCVRFKKLEDVPLDVVGRTIAGIDIDRFIEHYLQALPEERRKKALKRLEA